MLIPDSLALVAGASLSAAAAVAHLACIVIGPSAYRLMGAGERMARAAEAKQLRPKLITAAIAGILFIWSAYALSGAGVIPPLPMTRFVLILVSAIYLGRAIAAPLLKPAFPENSTAFWWISSSICAVIGILHAYGTFSLWGKLL